MEASLDDSSEDGVLQSDSTLVVAERRARKERAITIELASVGAPDRREEQHPTINQVLNFLNIFDTRLLLSRITVARPHKHHSLASTETLPSVQDDGQDPIKE